MSILRSLIMPAALATAIIVPVGVLAQQTPVPSGGAPAQTAPEHYGRHHGGMMHMLRDLNLSDQQKTQIQQIMQQFRQAHENGQRPDQQAREQLRSQIMNVLTPQQRTQLQNKMQQMRQERQEQEPQPQSTPQA